MTVFPIHGHPGGIDRSWVRWMHPAPRGPQATSVSSDFSTDPVTKLPDEVFMGIIPERLFVAWCPPNVQVKFARNCRALGTAQSPM